jgi:phosphoribosylaminoimidazole-succinocarboxamide synthase
LTPGFSRFWPADQYKPSANPPSYDKQFVAIISRASAGTKPPAPKLPPV